MYGPIIPGAYHKYKSGLFGFFFFFCAPTSHVAVAGNLFPPITFTTK